LDFGPVSAIRKSCELFLASPFWQRWGDGRAELAGYDLTTPRYGALRKGVAVTIFVISIAAIWLAIALASIYGPVLVTGTDPTRVPLTALVAPVAGTEATAFVCLYAAVTGGSRRYAPESA
jgi:hypothetical protein